MPVLVIEPAADRRLIITVDQAAARYRLKPPSMRAALARLDQDALAAITFALDGKKRAYLAVELDKLIWARPGRTGRPRRQASSAA